jgi:hypothetical protein
MVELTSAAERLRSTRFLWSVDATSRPLQTGLAPKQRPRRRAYRRLSARAYAAHRRPSGTATSSISRTLSSALDRLTGFDRLLVGWAAGGPDGRASHASPAPAAFPTIGAAVTALGSRRAIPWTGPAWPGRGLRAAPRRIAPPRAPHELSFSDANGRPGTSCCRPQA